MSHHLHFVDTLVRLLEQVVIIAVGADTMTATRLMLAMIETWRCDATSRVTRGAHRAAIVRTLPGRIQLKGPEND